MFKVGSRYLALDFLRERPYWSSPLGYEVFMNKYGYLKVIDGDGDVRGVEFLDPNSEVNFSLENE